MLIKFVRTMGVEIEASINGTKKRESSKPQTQEKQLINVSTLNPQFPTK